MSGFIGSRIGNPILNSINNRLFLLVSLVISVFTGSFSSSALAASLDDGSRYAFSPSYSEKRVYVFDLKDQEIADQIHLSEHPDQVLASDALDALIISHRQAQRLTLIDLSGSELIQLDYELDLTPDLIKLSPIGDTVAIYDSESKRLEVHNVKRRALLLEANDVDATSEFTFNADGSVLYWTDSLSGNLHAIDLWSKHSELSLVRGGGELSALSRSADGLLGFVSNTSADKVFVINMRDFSLLSTIAVPPGPKRPWGTADGRYMFVAGKSSNAVSAISTDSLLLKYSVRFADQPLSVHTGWLDTVAAVTTETGHVVFIEVESGKILKQYSLEKRPLEAIVTSDSKTLALPLSGSSKSQFAFFNMQDQTLGKTLQRLPADIGEASIAVSNNLCH